MAERSNPAPEWCVYMLPISHPLNIARVSRENAAGMLELTTARLEAKLSQRYGFARRAYAAGRTMACAVVCSALTLGCALAQVGGVL